MENPDFFFNPHELPDFNWFQPEPHQQENLITAPFAQDSILTHEGFIFKENPEDEDEEEEEVVDVSPVTVKPHLYEGKVLQINSIQRYSSNTDTILPIHKVSLTMCQIKAQLLLRNYTTRDFIVLGTLVEYKSATKGKKHTREIKIKIPSKQKLEYFCKENSVSMPTPNDVYKIRFCYEYSGECDWKRSGFFSSNTFKIDYDSQPTPSQCVQTPEQVPPTPVQLQPVKKAKKELDTQTMLMISVINTALEKLTQFRGNVIAHHQATRRQLEFYEQETGRLRMENNSLRDENKKLHDLFGEFSQK